MPNMPSVFKTTSPLLTAGSIKRHTLASVSYLTALCLLSSCAPDNTCLRPTLPNEPHPNMLSVVLAPDAQYCMDEQSAKNVRVNIENYYGALERCNATISTYNKTIQEKGR